MSMRSRIGPDNALAIAADRRLAAQEHAAMLRDLGRDQVDRDAAGLGEAAVLIAARTPLACLAHG